MIINLSKKRKINNLLVFFVFLILFQCKEKIKTSQKLSVINKATLNDTLFFKCKSVFEDNCIESDKLNSNLYRIIKKEENSFYNVINYVTRNNKIVSKGKLINFNKTKPLDAKYEGKWYFYGDADIGLYKIGNYTNGKKEGIWYTVYEDSFPKLEYYKNDIKIAYKDSIVILDDKNNRIAFGKGISREGLPAGEWSFYLNNGNILSKRQFINKEGKITIKYKNFDVKTNSLLSEGVFDSEE